MRRRRLITVCAAAAIALAVPAGLRAETDDVFDGETKSLVVVGYSTSFMWPDMLQVMLDQHGGEGVYHVLNAAVGGSPVVSWTKGSKPYERTYQKMLDDYFGDNPKERGDRPQPTIALCQQSLQGVFGDRQDGIRNEDDVERIEKGAGAFLGLAEQLYADGIETVYIAAHIFKISMEPQIGNEQLALDFLLGRGIPNILQGPKLWRVTKDSYPEGFSVVDKVHPSVHGARIMAEGWYRALAGDDAKNDVVKAMWDHPFEEITKRYAQGTARGLERRRERMERRRQEEGQQ